MFPSVTDAAARLVAVLALVVLPLGCATESGTDEPATETDAAPAEQMADTGMTEEGMTEEERLHKADPAGLYGAGLTLRETVALSAILEDPASYEGKKVQVRGTVQEVCPMRGCWIELAETASGEMIRVKVTDGEIVFPLSAKDKDALVEGVVERIEMTEEENRNWQAHLAEEQGKEFDPASVTGPATIWRIRGEGARIGG